jgi:DNA-binding MarR family transcriptional regulator
MERGITKEQIFIKKGKLRKDVLKRLLEPKTATEVSKEIEKHRSSVSRILLGLEKKGLVKCVNPEDDRYRHYQITHKGKESI